MIQIKSISGAVLYEHDADSVKAAIITAVAKGANLNRANLAGANLDGAILAVASLDGASLDGANLAGASLAGASLAGANLDGAILAGANLDGAILAGASLVGAILNWASLAGANLESTRLPAFFVCPETGAFIAHKKLRDNRIATLEIPANARRTSPLVGRKCRAEFAKVLAITSINGTEQFADGLAKHDGTPYHVGEVVRPDSYNDDVRIECANGIHFFITRQEAIDYL